MREDGGLTAAKIPIAAQIAAVASSASAARASVDFGEESQKAAKAARAEALDAAHRTLIWVRDNAEKLRQAAGSCVSPAAVQSAAGERPATGRSFSSLGFAQQAALRGQDARFWRFLGPLMGGAIIADAEGAAAAVRKLCAVASRKDFDASPAAAARWQSLDARFCAWLQGEGGE